MNRLKKELVSRSIVYENDGDYEEYRHLVGVTDKYIITIWGCLVLPSEIHLFDKNFNIIAKQDLFPKEDFFRKGKTWYSHVM